jgi:hypothetical protein
MDHLKDGKSRELIVAQMAKYGIAATVDVRKHHFRLPQALT